MPAAADAQTAEETGDRTSTLLLRAVRGDSERVSIADILDALDARAFGLATLLFAIPSILPMPPGVPTVVGFVLLIISFQMVIGRHELWLPGFISKRSFPRPALVSAMEKVAPRLEAIEKLAQPRLLFLTGKMGTILIGAVVCFMAIVLILPLPFGGNFPPALACAVLGMGLAERDGVIILIGLTASIAATVAVSLLTVVFIQSLPEFISWLGDSAVGVWNWIVGSLGF